jgi:hypothetical protein
MFDFMVGCGFGGACWINLGMCTVGYTLVA